LFLKFGMSSVIEQIGAFFRSVDNVISGVTSTAAPWLLDDFISRLTPTLNVVIYVLIALSVFMLVVGVFGCAGAYYSVRFLLATV